MPSPRRALVLTAAAVTLGLLAAPVLAGGSGARFTDARGDIAVPSLDIVSGAVRLESVRGARVLTMTATMAGDLTGVPADYDLVTSTRRGGTCHALATRVRWNGVALHASYQHSSSFACEGELTTGQLTALALKAAQYAVGGDAVRGEAVGSAVSVSLPAPDWLRPGSLASFGVFSHPVAYGIRVYGGAAEVSSYDQGGVARQWRVS